MQLEDYFTFEKVDTDHGVAEWIRFQGRRVSLDAVVQEFNEGKTPREIAADYDLTLEQVFAAVAYYLHNKAKVEEYLRRGEAIADAYYQDYLRAEPSPLRKRLMALKEQQQQTDAADGA